jgi:hypothetical protein
LLLQHDRLVLASHVAGLRRGEAERLVECLHQAHRRPTLGGKLLVGAVEAFRQSHHRRIQECQRQGALIDQPKDRLDREPRCRPRPQQPCTPDRAGGSQLTLIAGQRAGRDQLSHKALGHVRALGDFFDAVRHFSSCLLDCLIIAAQTRRRVAWQ